MIMHCLRFRITARSPLIISTISGDMNMVATERFIPGTTVLGVLVSRFIEKQKNELKGRAACENDTFYNWFLSGQLKFSNAYILSQDEYGDHAHYPTPLSIEKEKYGEMVYDLLALEQEAEEPTAHVGDFCLLRGDSIQTRRVETSISFHHARDREKGVSQEGMIFNYESILSNQVFEGSIFGAEADLKKLLSICESKWTAFVGRSRNAQYGTAGFEFIDKEPISERRQIVWPEDEEGNPAEHISMTLLSDLSLYNEYGYPTTDAKDLLAALKRFIGEVAIEAAFVRKREIENFVGVWQLKKPSEVCFAAGSTFLLKVNPDDREQLVKIQQDGIGERTHEGFGRCAFCLQTRPELYLRDEIKEEAELELPKPDGDIPDMAGRILKKVVQDAIIQKIELQAVNKQEEFDRLPSNTLIARLEAMAKHVRDHSEFAENIKKLRGIASGQLERCVSRESILLELLCKDAIDWQSFFRERENVQLKSLCEQIGYDPKQDEELRQQLLKSYLVTFFSSMRKRAIAEREDGNV